MRFYTDLGWKTNGIVGEEYENGAVVFFDLDNGMRLALYERKNLAWDSCLPKSPDSATELSMGYFVNSEDDVNAIMSQAEQAGATVIKPAQKTFWGGYGGYFQDPDGHLWEIGHMPGWEVKE